MRATAPWSRTRTCRKPSSRRKYSSACSTRVRDSLASGVCHTENEKKDRPWRACPRCAGPAHERGRAHLACSILPPAGEPWLPPPGRRACRGESRPHRRPWRHRPDSGILLVSHLAHVCERALACNRSSGREDWPQSAHRASRPWRQSDGERPDPCARAWASSNSLRGRSASRP